MKEISEAQARIYNFLRERIQTDGVPPSVREICTATGIRSTSTVHYHLKALENAGYISRDEGLNRSIRIVGESARFIPVLGRVTAASRFWRWRMWKIICPLPAASSERVSCSPCGSWEKA